MREALHEFTPALAGIRKTRILAVETVRMAHWPNNEPRAAVGVGVGVETGKGSLPALHPEPVGVGVPVGE